MTTLLCIALITFALGLLWAVGAMAMRDENPVPPAPVRRRVRAEVPTALYHYPNPVGGWVYIGITNCPAERHLQHMAEAAWMRRSTGVMVIDRWYPNRAAAGAAERRAIRAAAYAGEPIANQVHHPAGRIRRAVH